MFITVHEVKLPIEGLLPVTLIKTIAKDVDDMYIFVKTTFFFVLMGTNVFHLQ